MGSVDSRPASPPASCGWTSEWWCCSRDALDTRRGHRLERTGTVDRRGLRSATSPNHEGVSRSPSGTRSGSPPRFHRRRPNGLLEPSFESCALGSPTTRISNSLATHCYRDQTGLRGIGRKGWTRISADCGPLVCLAQCVYPRPGTVLRDNDLSHAGWKKELLCIEQTMLTSE